MRSYREITPKTVAPLCLFLYTRMALLVIGGMKPSIGQEYVVGRLQRKPAKTSSASAGHDAVDEQAFQACYQEHFGLIYRYVSSQVGNREEAEDLVAQIFLTAARRMNQERGLQSMQHWLFHVARITVADYWRVHSRVSVSSPGELLGAGWEGTADEETLPSSSHALALTGGRLQGRVKDILRLLPEQYREVLICRFLLSLSIRETAQWMGLTETHVKAVQYQALKLAADLESVVSR